MITDIFAGILVLIWCWNNCVYCIYPLYWGLAYICEGIFALRIYVAVVFPYLRDQGVTGIFILRINVAVSFLYPMGRGVTRWYQSLGW